MCWTTLLLLDCRQLKPTEKLHPVLSPPPPPTGPATGFSRGVSYVSFQQVARNQGQHAYSSSEILNAVFGEHLARNAQGPRRQYN